MVKGIALKVVAATLSLSLLSSNFAWAQADAGIPTEQRAELTGTRKQLATIIFSGLAGAILGLSTLSFYGRPQEKLSNIALGFAFGIIGGTIYTTYKAATNPYEMYDLDTPGALLNFEKEKGLSFDPPPLLASYTWEF